MTGRYPTACPAWPTSTRGWPPTGCARSPSGPPLILAGHPGIADRGAAAFKRLTELGATRVHFATVGGFEANAHRRQTTSLTPDSGGAWGYPMLPDTPTSLPVVPGSPFPSSTLSGSRPSQLIATPPIAPPVAPTVAPSRATRAGRLIEQLRAASDLGALGTVLDAVGTFVPMSVSAGDIKDAAALVHAVMELEQVFTTPPGPLRLRMALRHTADAHFLRALAADLPRAREHRDVYLAIFARMGDAAVEAMVDRLVHAELAKDRRVLFEAIVGFGGGVPTIVRMLDDERWYVVRNAAELLGRLAAPEGEQPLVELLRHPEARVRRSAAVALIRIGPATAVTALVAAMS
jgi:hypothetical protein